MTYEDFISRFPKLTKTTKGVLVKCPSHDDGTASLQIAKGNDGRILLHCFANCTTESVLGALGLKMKDLFPNEPARQFSIPASSKPESNTTEKPVIDKIYSYRNALGDEVYQAIRMKPKSFRQRQQDLSGKWIWNMDGVDRVLYQLPEVMKADTVIITEGEKDADNLSELGFCATCNAGGAGKWLDGYTASLEGKNVILCGDNDEPGKKHVELVFDSIMKVAKTVKVLKLPDSVKDASDYIATFKTKEDAKHALDDLIELAYPHVKGFRLPIYTVGELEQSYRRMVRKMGECSFSLGRWIPSLSQIRPLIAGELVFIIGDTGIGKTGVAQAISRVASPMPRIFFELELPKELMFERYASMVTGMDGLKIEEAYRLSDESISEQLDESLKNLFICPESRLSLEQIENYIHRSELKIGEKPKMVIIDYIQLMQSKGANRRERVSDIAEGLKVMAKETGTIVIVTSQVRRPANEDENEITLHSAKESGSIESSCGILIGLWRADKDTMKLRILKSTKGGGGLEITCNFDGAKMRITERAKQSIDAEDVPYHDR